IIRIADNNIIAKEFEAKAKAMEAKKKAEPILTKVFKINYAEGKDVLDAIKKANYLSDRGNATLDEMTSTLIVKDTAAAIEEIEELLKTIDRQTPQVMIEARIVQVDTSMRNTFGIQWGAFTIGNRGDSILTGSGIGSSTLIFPEFTSKGLAFPFADRKIPLAVNLPALAANSAVEFGLINKSAKFGLDVRLTALENMNKGRILSTPKVFTLDNKPAVLKEGLKVPYPVQSEDGVSTAYADVTTSLTVTPHITPNGTILLDLDVKKIELLGFDSLGAVSAPRLSDSSVLTKVLVRDGDTVVIGGMFKESNTKAEGGTPFFNKIPILKLFFTNKDRQMAETEILFFITPIIVKKS
ncbi:MAG: hypothetical protein D6828_06075, partial [Nitrospirae bacterium]